MHRCRGLIEHYKEYPVMARKGMIEGTVVVRGTLARDGSLRQCGVTRTSKSGLLDNAALRAVRSVERFPPVPPELLGNELAFELPVSFRLSAE
jgi:protein TonB